MTHFWQNPVASFRQNPVRALTRTEARGLRRLYLTAGLPSPKWGVLLDQTVTDKFGVGGFDTVDRLVADGLLRPVRRVGVRGWEVTPAGKAAFHEYVKQHGMPAR